MVRQPTHLHMPTAQQPVAACSMCNANRPNLLCRRRRGSRAAGLLPLPPLL